MPGVIEDRIKAAVFAEDDYFKMRRDCTEHEYASTDQKLVASITKLIHGVSAAHLTNEIWLAKSTMHKFRKLFVRALCASF